MQKSSFVCCRYHYSFNTGLQSQSVLYSQADLTSKETTLLDPNKLSQDGTVYLLTQHAVYTVLLP